MNVLVTGGAGFLGGHLADALLARGDRVRLLDNCDPKVHPGGRPLYIPPGAELCVGDVRSRADWVAALGGMDAVVHLAAYQDYLTDFATFYQVNVAGTALLYEILVAGRSTVRRVVVASSQAVHGEGLYRCQTHGEFLPGMRPLVSLERGDWEQRCPRCTGPMESLPTSEEWAHPENVYAMSKHAQEVCALTLGRRYGIPTVALRYSIVQGPRQSFWNAYSGVCRIFCLAALHGRPAPVYEDGFQRRDYVNIHDAIAAALLALDGKAEGTVNVGGGRAYTVLELAGIVEEVSGRPLDLDRRGAFRVGDTRHSISDVSRLRAVGWDPRQSPKRSIRDYWEWLQEQGVIEDRLAAAGEGMRRTGVVRGGTGT